VRRVFSLPNTFFHVIAIFFDLIYFYCWIEITYGYWE
jgi:hypothetical protein